MVKLTQYYDSSSVFLEEDSIKTLTVVNIDHKKIPAVFKEIRVEFLWFFHQTIKVETQAAQYIPIWGTAINDGIAVNETPEQICKLLGRTIKYVK